MRWLSGFHFIKTFFYTLRFTSVKDRSVSADLSGVSDERLMVMYAKHSDIPAFEELLKRYRSQVFGFLIRWCRNRSEAEDLYQETFMRVVRSASSYQPRASFRTWLFTIVRNLVIDRKRRQTTRGSEISMTVEDGRSSAGEPAGSHPSTNPYAAEKSREIRQAVLEILVTLPPEQREMFLLREEAGLSFREASGVAECSENTAKSRMRYALIKLRDELTVRGIHPEKSTVVS